MVTPLKVNVGEILYHASSFCINEYEKNYGLRVNMIVSKVYSLFTNSAWKESVFVHYNNHANNIYFFKPESFFILDHIVF